MKEWWGYNTFFKIYVSLYYPSKRSKLFVSVRDRQRQGDEGQEHKLAEDCYIYLFLIHFVILYSGPYDFASLTMFSTVFLLGGHLTSAYYGHSLAVTLRESMTLLLTVWHGYPCIYNFITLTCSDCDSPDLILLVNPHELSACLHGWNILFQKSLLDGSVKGQHPTWITSLLLVFF